MYLIQEGFQPLDNESDLSGKITRISHSFCEKCLFQLYLGEMQPHATLEFSKVQDKAIGKPTSITF